jgi:RNA polymerase sigma-54 factor
VLARPIEHIEIAVRMIQHLNPRPGLRYSGAGARVVEPDVFSPRTATITSFR